MKITKEQLSAALQTLTAVAAAIRELREVPAGHLYAQLMSRMDLPSFESLVSTLVKSGLVEKRGDLLKWIGDKQEGQRS